MRHDGGYSPGDGLAVTGFPDRRSLGGFRGSDGSRARRNHYPRRRRRHGAGSSISDAIASGNTEPVLVNGVLYMDTDGSIYLSDSLTDASVPTFGGVRLEVVDYPTGGAEWDIANADVTGLQEVNGVLFFEDHQLYGIVGS